MAIYILIAICLLLISLLAGYALEKLTAHFSPPSLGPVTVLLLTVSTIAIFYSKGNTVLWGNIIFIAISFIISYKSKNIITLKDSNTKNINLKKLIFQFAFGIVVCLGTVYLQHFQITTADGNFVLRNINSTKPNIILMDNGVYGELAAQMTATCIENNFGEAGLVNSNNKATNAYHYAEFWLLVTLHKLTHLPLILLLLYSILPFFVSMIALAVISIAEEFGIKNLFWLLFIGLTIAFYQTLNLNYLIRLVCHYLPLKHQRLFPSSHFAFYGIQSAGNIKMAVGLLLLLSATKVWLHGRYAQALCYFGMIAVQWVLLLPIITFFFVSYLIHSIITKKKKTIIPTLVILLTSVAFIYTYYAAQNMLWWHTSIERTALNIQFEGLMIRASESLIASIISIPILIIGFLIPFLLKKSKAFIYVLIGYIFLYISFYFAFEIPVINLCLAVIITAIALTLYFRFFNSDYSWIFIVFLTLLMNSVFHTAIHSYDSRQLEGVPLTLTAILIAILIFCYYFSKNSKQLIHKTIFMGTLLLSLGLSANQYRQLKASNTESIDMNFWKNVSSQITSFTHENSFVLGAFLNRNQVSFHPLYQRLGLELNYFCPATSAINLGTAQLLDIEKRSEWIPYLHKTAYAQFLDSKQIGLTQKNEQIYWPEFIKTYKIQYVILHPNVLEDEVDLLKSLYSKSMISKTGLIFLYDLKTH